MQLWATEMCLDAARILHGFDALVIGRQVDLILTEPSHSASRPGGLERRAALCVNGIQGDFRGMDAADDARFLGLLFGRIDRAIGVRMVSVVPSSETMVPSTSVPSVR